MAPEDIQPAVKKPRLCIRDVLPAGEIWVIALLFQSENPPFTLNLQYGKIKKGEGYGKCGSFVLPRYFELETQPDTLGRVTELLEQNEIVTQVYRVTGKNKLHVHAVAASGDEMEKLIREVIDPLPGIVRCDCNIILSRIKDIKGLRL